MSRQTIRQLLRYFDLMESHYLTIFLSGSVLWRQRVVSLSHLNQPLLNDLFLLQQLHTGQDSWGEGQTSFSRAKTENIVSHFWLYLDNVFGKFRDGLRGGCDIPQDVWQSIQGGVCSWGQLRARTQAERIWCNCRFFLESPKRLKGYLCIYLLGSFCGKRSTRGGSKVVRQSIQSKVCRALKKW